MDTQLADLAQIDPSLLLSPAGMAPSLTMPMGFMVQGLQQSPAAPSLFGDLGALGSMPFMMGPPMMPGPSSAFVMDPSSPSLLLQELQEIDHRIDVERSIAKHIMSGLNGCDPANLHNLKLRLSASATNLDALLQQKRLMQARMSTITPIGELEEPFTQADAVEQANFNNNSRLLVLSRRLSSSVTFLPAIEELTQWCSDPRAFGPRTSSCLRDCLAVVRAYAGYPGFDRDLCARLFATCRSHAVSMTPEVANEVSLWFASQRRPEQYNAQYVSRAVAAVAPAPAAALAASAAPNPAQPFALAPSLSPMSALHLPSAVSSSFPSAGANAASSLAVHVAGQTAPDAMGGGLLHVRIGEPLIPPFQVRHGIKRHSLSFSLPQDFEDLFRTRTDVILAMRCFHAHDKLRRCAWPPGNGMTVNSFRIAFDEGVPVDLRFACHTGLNVIELETKQCACGFLYEMCFIQKVPMGMVEKAAERRRIPAQVARERIIEQAKKEGKGSITLSLSCPVSNGRITKPARGSNCKHAQCFDLRSYLLYHAHLSQWLCPLCRELVTYSDLVLDGFEEELLAAVEDKDREINVDLTGRWTRLSSSASAPAADAASAASAAAATTTTTTSPMDTSEGGAACLVAATAGSSGSEGSGED